jgi:O-antigen/teichoic acid export membrane protein
MMALVNPLITGLQMFSEIGIGPSIVQNERGNDPAFVNTAWTLQVFRGFALFAVACLAAFPAARFYHQPQIAHLVIFVAGTAIIAGFNSTKLFTASRNLLLGRLTVIELCSQLVGVVLMIVVAALTRSVWALACYGVGASIANLLLSHLLLPGRGNRFRWDGASLSALASFGRWMFPSTVLTFLATQADRLIFGKFLTLGQLGIYNIASLWAAIPVFVLGHLMSTVVFPVLSRVHNEGKDVGAWFRKTRRSVVFAAAWLCSCLIAGGATGMSFLYGARAVQAGWIIPILAIGSWFHALENCNTKPMLAIGQPKWLAATNSAKVLGMLAFIPGGYMLGHRHGIGFEGAVWGLTCADLLKCGVSVFATVRTRISAWQQDLALTFGIALISGLGWVTRSFATRAHLPTLLEGMVVFAVVSGAWWLVYRGRWEPGAQDDLVSES